MSAEENLRAYFRTIWRDTEGVVYLPSRGENPKDWVQTLFAWPSQEDRIVKMVQARTGDREVFVNPVLYRDNGKRDKSTILRSNVLGTWTLWVDFDGNAPSEWTGNIPLPTMRVQTSTSTHQHCYWALDQLLSDPTEIENRNRTLAYQLEADTSGWDVSQLLRPPSTTNHKYGKDDPKSYDVFFEELSDKVYPASIVATESFVRPIVKSALAHADIPKISEVLAFGKWNEKFYDLFTTELPAKDRSGAIYACAMYAAEAGFSDEQIFAVVKDADDRWGKYTGRHPTDRLRQLINIVDRARREHPYGTDDVEFGSLFEDATPVEDAPKVIFSFKEFMDANITVSWVLENLFPQKGYGIIYGMPGVGKTLIGMILANCLCFGQNFMVWKNVSGPQKVLFLSLEMNHPTLKLQYSKMVASFSDQQKRELSERLFIAPLAETLPLDKPEGRAKLENWLIEYRPDVLFIDSLSESSYASLLDDNGVREFNRFIRYIREKYVCSIYVVHHDRKSGATRHQDLDSMWGSRFISSAADFILFLESTEPESDQIWMVQDKNRLGTKEAQFLIDRNWVDFSFTYGGRLQDSPTDRLRSELSKNGRAGSFKPSKADVDFGDLFDDSSGDQN